MTGAAHRRIAVLAYGSLLHTPGNELADRGRGAEALPLWTQAEAIDPSYAMLHYRKALCLLKLGREKTERIRKEVL